MIHPGVIACCSQQSGGIVYTTNLSIDELQYNSFGTFNFGGSVFGFPAAMAVGPNEVVVGTSSAINPGMGSMNVFSFNVDTGSPLSGTTSISGGLLSQQGSIRGMVFGKDGEKLYVAGQGSPGGNANALEEFTLSSAYDITTASSEGIVALGTGLNALQGIAISGDGTKFYAMRSTSGSVGFVREYAMGTAFDITSLSTTRDVTAAHTGNWSGGFTMDIAVSPDQSKFTMATLSGTSNNFQTIIDEWPMTDGDISPISGTSGRKSANFSQNISDSWDSTNNDSLTYVQGYNFTPNGQSLILAGVHMDDGSSGSSNQFHITRWVD